MPRKKSHIPDNSAEHNLRTFEYYAKPNHYDRTLRDYRDRLKSKYSKAYDANAAMLRDEYSHEVNKALCIDSVYRKRRINAFLDVIKHWAEKFEDRFPNLCVDDELGIFCSALMSRTPDILDTEENITLALALFILDSVLKSGNWTAAVYFIPRGEFKEIELPYDFEDATFDNDVIRGVMYLIKHRMNSGYPYFCPETAAASKENSLFCEYRKYAVEQSDEEYRFGEISGTVSEESAVKYFTAAEKMTVQERYFALISFIRPEIIERAVQRFRDKTDEMIEIMLNMTAKYRTVCAEKAEKGIALTYELEKAERQLAEQTEKIMSKIKQHKKTKNTLNVLNNTRADDLGSFSDDDIRFTVETSLTLERVDSLKDKIAILASEIEYEDIILRERLDKMRFKLSDNARQTEPEEADGFTISNPYEILFGFLYLLDSGDSLPWIPHVFENVCGYAVQQLPWNSRNNKAYWDLIDERMEEHYSNSDKDDDSVSVRKYDRTAEDDSEQYADLYEMKYTDAFMWVRENMKFQKDELISFNLPQMIYEASSVCMPRYRANMYEDVQAFVKSGMSRKQAELMRYFKSFAEFSTNKHGFADVIKTENLIRERSGNAVNQSTSELRQILSTRNDEIEALKKKLYEAEKQASDLNKKIDKMRDDSATENQELLELRDLIYKIQNSSGEEEESQESTVSFPYRTKARVVVFGGHATWLKVIVKLLPNVKFIDPYTDPDVNSIRNADVVWMQTNAMPHSRYNKIMEIVRIKKIPVKYFAYASAEKCAVQVVQYDSDFMLDDK